MQTVLFTHSACLEHEPPLGHPESPDRLRAVLRAFDSEDFFYLHREQAPLASAEQIVRAHTQVYVDSILGIVPPDGHDPVFIDGDTALSSGSGEAMLRAAGAVIAAADAVMAGTARNAFCAVRPPGHHAERTTAMGFCFFNNVAVGAHHARAAHGLERVAVIDFDVHHGNGTQDIFAPDRNLFYASSHQMPLFPGTGLPDETGVAGNILNCILKPGAGSDEFRQIYADRILPRLAAFKPELILISAGFDAHIADPLAHISLTEEDYAWITREIMAIADTQCQGRIVSSLEGGYDLRALAVSTTAHVRALMGA